MNSLRLLTILISNCTAKRNLLAVTDNVCITNANFFYVNNSRNILPTFIKALSNVFLMCDNNNYPVRVCLAARRQLEGHLTMCTVVTF